MTNYEEFVEEQMKNPEFRREYESLEEEFNLIEEYINAKNAIGFSQEDVSEKSGVSKSFLNRFEQGNANPSFRTLQKIANALGCKLEIKFKPM